MSDINTLAQYNQKIVESLTINVHFIWANCKNLICWDCFVASSWQWLQRHHLSLQAKRGNPILEYFCNYLIFYRLMITEIFLGDCRVNNRLEILCWWKVIRSDKGKSIFRLTETSDGYSNTHRVLQTHGTYVFFWPEIPSRVWLKPHELFFGLTNLSRRDCSLKKRLSNLKLCLGEW